MQQKFGWIFEYRKLDDGVKMIMINVGFLVINIIIYSSTVSLYKQLVA